jgi:hypothetical protein
MKKIALLALLVIIGPTLAGTGEAASYGDTEQAFKDCLLFLENSRRLTEEESIRANSCSNFVIGAWDMGAYLSWRDIFLGKNPPFCPPQEPVAVTQPILVFVNYIEEHPEKVEHRLAMVLEWSFNRAYPCSDAFYMALGK